MLSGLSCYMRGTIQPSPITDALYALGLHHPALHRHFFGSCWLPFVLRYWPMLWPHDMQLCASQNFHKAPWPSLLDLTNRPLCYVRLLHVMQLFPAYQHNDSWHCRLIHESLSFCPFSLMIPMAMGMSWCTDPIVSQIFSGGKIGIRNSFPDDWK